MDCATVNPVSITTGTVDEHLITVLLLLLTAASVTTSSNFCRLDVLIKETSPSLSVSDGNPLKQF